MEEKGKTANSKHTKHIKIRSFFITDHIKEGQVNIAYCSTKKMLSGIFTKPLQGAKFWEMRAQLMNCPIDYHKHTTEMINTLIEIHKPVIPFKGCVEINTKQSGEIPVDWQNLNGSVDKSKCQVHWQTPVDNLNTWNLEMLTHVNWQHWQLKIWLETLCR